MPTESKTAANQRWRRNSSCDRVSIASSMLALACPLSACQQPSPKPVQAIAPEKAQGRSAPSRPWHDRPGRGTWVEPQAYVASEPGPGRFAVAWAGHAAPIWVSAADHKGVLRAAADLQNDIERVTSIRPELVQDPPSTTTDRPVIIGTLGKSALVDRLVREGKLDTSGVSGKWETFVLTAVERPLPSVERALVIAGSDPRGTIYGTYDLSTRMGVSPWHYWDDVPPQKKTSVFVLPGRHSLGEPAVKYRGFFINDENPALGTWALRTFGPGRAPSHPQGFNRGLYSKVFELMLRLKANYLWPAVWGRAFAEDDPENQATADLYGVVMGTSHEAPMNRGIEEWNRHAVPAERDALGNVVKPGRDPYGGTGEWSFRRNRAAIEAYWAEGVKRIGNSEVIVTLGMRGNGDTSLGDGPGIDLMQNIVRSERRILGTMMQRDVRSIPQVWTLYKEVQNYWERGMRAPDDVTIVWCDDNWGNLRKLPDPTQPPRTGGYGIYYHFDYVGGSRNYKWVDTNLLPNVWEQLHLAYEYGVDQLWMVNVGDLKNVELPLQFFLDYAWSPERWPLTRLDEWERQWSEQQFGPRLAEPIANLLHRYAQLQARRKPELLNRRIDLDPTKDLQSDPEHAVVYDDAASPFSLIDYREFEAIVQQWQSLADDAARVKSRVPPHLADAYYQLVFYQIEASALLYELRLAEFTNLHYVRQGRVAANQLADTTEKLFERSAEMADFYNRSLANGKWNGFQTQPYLGYGDAARYGSNASWQQPEKNDEALPDQVYPPVQRLSAKTNPDMGVAIDGSDKVWPGESAPAVLPTFSPFQRQPAQYVEVFNRGTQPFDFDITASVPWLYPSPPRGRVREQARVALRVDWSKAPKGETRPTLTISGPAGKRVTVRAVVWNPDLAGVDLRGFIESNGYVSIEADHFSRAIEKAPVFWQRIPDIGRTGSGMTSFPVTAASQLPAPDSPRLEYELHFFSYGPVDVWAYHSPRNDVLHGVGVRYAVSFDDEPPLVVPINQVTGASPMNKSWERNTADNVTRTSTRHTLGAPGAHVLRYWRVDPTLILQKLVVDTGDLKPSYLGPPESHRVGAHP